MAALWMGTTITEPKDESMSAFGVGFEVSGVALGEIKNESPLGLIGFKTGDLMIGMNGEKTNSIKNLMSLLAISNNKIQAKRVNVLFIILGFIFGYFLNN